jgi:hypothetical protein
MMSIGGPTGTEAGSGAAEVPSKFKTAVVTSVALVEETKVSFSFIGLHLLFSHDNGDGDGGDDDGGRV